LSIEQSFRLKKLILKTRGPGEWLSKNGTNAKNRLKIESKSFSKAENFFQGK
jgi:hypothetical protein